MTTPQTLLQIAGAPAHPSPLDAAVLVLVDVQNEYVNGRLALPGIDAAIAEAAKLLGLARKRGVPVVHIVQQGRPGGPVFTPDTPLAEIVSALAPATGEEVIGKPRPNAFSGTRLQQALEEIAAKTGRKELILAGCMTHMCVSATARAALDLGIRTTVVAGATATRDLPDPLGGVVPAATVQRTALAELADRFAIVVADCSALS